MTGELLRQVRNAMKLTCPRMARLLGVTVRTYYRYEQAAEIPLTVHKLLVTLLKYPQVRTDMLAELDSEV